MPLFTSKLQYKNYEKGEYSDQKARSLDDTLQLIKTFPWEQQRGTDVQLTGPSVTMQDDNGNYLKVGLYFGGKFCLYYFTVDHHLYERHVETYDEIAEVATDFFAGQVEMEKFERTMLVLNAVSHFEDAAFDYQVSSTKIYGRLVLLIVLMLFFTGDGAIIILVNSPFAVKLLFPAFILFIIGLIGYQQYMALRYYRRSKNMYLELSAGRDTFRFGDNDSIKEYNKTDITEINTYGPLGGRSKPILTICKLVFKDGSQIKLPGMLIDPLTVPGKFTGIKINRFDRTNGYLAEQKAFARGGNL